MSPEFAEKLIYDLTLQYAIQTGICNKMPGEIANDTEKFDRIGEAYNIFRSEIHRITQN